MKSGLNYLRSYGGLPVESSGEEGGWMDNVLYRSARLVHFQMSWELHSLGGCGGVGGVWGVRLTPY